MKKKYLSPQIIIKLRIDDGGGGGGGGKSGMGMCKVTFK